MGEAGRIDAVYGTIMLTPTAALGPLFGTGHRQNSICVLGVKVYYRIRNSNGVRGEPSLGLAHKEIVELSWYRITRIYFFDNKDRFSLCSRKN